MFIKFLKCKRIEEGFFLLMIFNYIILRIKMICMVVIIIVIIIFYKFVILCFEVRLNFRKSSCVW